VFQSAREKFLAKMLQAQQQRTAAAPSITRRPVLGSNRPARQSHADEADVPAQSPRPSLSPAVSNLLSADVFGKGLSPEEKSQLLSSFRPDFPLSSAPVSESRLGDERVTSAATNGTVGEPTLSEALWTLQESMLKCLQPVVCGLEEATQAAQVASSASGSPAAVASASAVASAPVAALEATVKLLADLNANLTKLRARVHLEQVGSNA
jgi:hypothetical protein